MDHDSELDARGLLCPLPVLKTRKRLAPLASDEILRVITDDPAAVIDMPHFCAEAGHHLIQQKESGSAMIWYLRKK